MTVTWNLSVARAVKTGMVYIGTVLIRRWDAIITTHYYMSGVPLLYRPYQATSFPSHSSCLLPHAPLSTKFGSLHLFYVYVTVRPAATCCVMAFNISIFFRILRLSKEMRTLLSFSANRDVLLFISLINITLIYYILLLP